MGNRIAEMFSLEEQECNSRRLENSTMHDKTTAQDSNSHAISKSYLQACLWKVSPLQSQAPKAVCWHTWKIEANPREEQHCMVEECCCALASQVG